MNPNLLLSLPEFISAKDYWEKKLSGEVYGAKLPYDFIKVGYERKSYQISFDDVSLASKLLETKSGDLALYVVLLSALKITLFKYTGQNDIIIGSPVYLSGGESFQYNDGIALRTVLNDGMALKELFTNIKQTVIDGYKNQHYPFAEILGLLSQGDDSQFFRTILVLENIHQSKHLSGILNQFENDLTISFLQTETGINGEIGFNSKLYSADTINRFNRHYLNVLYQILSNYDQTLIEIQMISAEEKKRIIYEFNDTQLDYPKDRTLYELFEEIANKSPDKVALVYEDQQITYGELNEKANQLAKYLRDKGVKPDYVVGIMFERSSEMIIGTIGIIKAGGAYLPIAPEYPEERIQFMIEDSNMEILLTQKHIKEKYQFNCEIIDLGDPALYNNKILSLENTNQSSDLAYIIYTSGTTGKPRGVMITHQNIVRLVKSTNYIEFNTEDRILQTGAIVFDASTFEIWGSLLNGLTLYIVNEDVILDADKLKQALLKYKITILWLTSSLFNQMSLQSPEIFNGLKYLLVGGDVLSPGHINQVRNRCKNIKIINGYGPTENTTFSVCFQINNEYEERIPIGKPINNSTAYIMGKDGNLQPIGVPGELYVGGDGVGRGYLNQPTLTIEKFVANPINPQERVYRTGDLARWLPDGNIDFLGRLDFQVKIRGFRIELGEIESQLLKHVAIQEAVVITKEDDNYNKYLSAYIVIQKEFKDVVNVTVLREHLLQALPEYMIPSYFFIIEKLPLTPNGKIDRKVLLAIENKLKLENQYIPPENITEGKLKKIWEDILGVDEIGISHNFFELGGHSLKATLLMSKVLNEFNVELSLNQIFKNPTIKGLANIIGSIQEKKYVPIPKVDEAEYYDLSPAQKRLFIVNQLSSIDTSYNIPLGIIIEGNLNINKLEKILNQIICRHEVFRTSFHINNGKIVQKVHAKVDFQINFFVQKTIIKEIDKIVNDFITPFDLGKAPLWRIGLFKLSENKFLLIIDIHHIIFDGTSLGIFVNEFIRLYNGEELPELKIQYKDFCEWLNNPLKTKSLKSQEKYWIEKFSHELPSSLPTDFERSIINSFNGASLNFKIGQEITNNLKNIALNNELTLYFILFGAFNILLSKFSGQEDVIVGTPIAGRTFPELDKVIGMFVNTLAIRNYPNGDKTIKEFLEEVKINFLEAYENQEYPFEDLVNKFNLNRKNDSNLLFNTMFILQNFSIPKIQINDLSVTTYRGDYKKSKFDITLEVVEVDGVLNLIWEYNRDLYLKETINILLQGFCLIIDSIIRDVEIKIKDIKINVQMKILKKAETDSIKFNI